MFHYFFKQLPEILFYPFYLPLIVLSVAGVIFCRKRMDWFLWLMCCFALLWRAGIKLSSARYAELLILPAILCTAYLLMQFHRALMERHPTPKARLGVTIAISVLCAGMVFAELGKIFHTNPYSRYLIEVSEMIRNDSGNASGAGIISDKETRWEYYTKLPTQLVPPEFRTGSGGPAKLRAMLALGKLFHDRSYIIDGKPDRDAPYSPGELQLKPEELQHLGTFRKNRRNALLHVYRYTPLHPFTLRAVSSAVPEPAENLIKNGDFSIAFPLEPKDGANSYYRKVKSSPRFEQSSPIPDGKLFPLYWDVIWAAGYEDGRIGNVYLVPKDSGETSYALRMRSDRKCSIRYAERFFPAGSYLLRYKIRVVEPAEVGIGFSLYTQEQEYVTSRAAKMLDLPAGWEGSIECSFDSQCVFPYPFFGLFLMLQHGEIEIDDVTMVDTDRKAGESR